MCRLITDIPSNLSNWWKWVIFCKVLDSSTWKYLWEYLTHICIQYHIVTTPHENILAWYYRLGWLQSTWWYCALKTTLWWPLWAVTWSQISDWDYYRQGRPYKYHWNHWGRVSWHKIWPSWRAYQCWLIPRPWLWLWKTPCSCIIACHNLSLNK